MIIRSDEQNTSTRKWDFSLVVLFPRFVAEVSDCVWIRVQAQLKSNFWGAFFSNIIHFLKLPQVSLQTDTQTLWEILL